MISLINLKDSKRKITILLVGYIILTLIIIGSDNYARISYADDSLPTIKLDKQAYTPFDIATITVYDKSKNMDPNAKDTLTVTVKGRNAINVTLYETDNNSSIFIGTVKLTPNPLLYKGDVEVRRDDWLVVVYNTLVAYASEIRYNEARLEFDKEHYYDTDTAKITLYDPDADRDPYTRDKAIVYVWSDSDPNGVRVVLDEKDVHSGVFEGFIKLITGKEKHENNLLRVSDNDKITARYIDDTLPKPSRLSSDNITTVEMKFIYAHAIYGTGIPANERVYVSEPKVVSQFGEDIRILSMGSRLAIQSELFNKQPKEQRFVYIVQVIDSDGFVEHIAYISTLMQAESGAVVAQAWTPMKRGNYTIEVFVWDSLEKPIALSGIKVIRVIVS
jgi:hypothetical protein